MIRPSNSRERQLAPAADKSITLLIESNETEEQAIRDIDANRVDVIGDLRGGNREARMLLREVLSA